MLEGTRLAVFNLRFQAAIHDHVAKKATSRAAKAAARRTAAELRRQAADLESMAPREAA